MTKLFKELLKHFNYSILLIFLIAGMFYLVPMYNQNITIYELYALIIGQIILVLVLLIQSFRFFRSTLHYVITFYLEYSEQVYYIPITLFFLSSLYLYILGINLLISGIIDFTLLVVILFFRFIDKLDLEKYKQYYSSIESFERQIEPVYFTPYPIYLIAQNECQKMVYLIKAMIIFITILPLSIVFKSEPVLNIFQDVLDYLVIEFFVLIILIIIFGPLAIYFTKKDLEEHYNLNQAVIFHNVDLLTQILQMYEQHIPKSEQIKRRTIVTYYKALILLNTGKYNEMITEVTRVLKSYYGFFAIKYEFYNLLGRAYQKLDENTKARENFIKSMEGFKKLHFYEPVHQIEKILRELPIV